MMYAKEESTKQSQKASGNLSQQNLYGPGIGWAGGRITLSGTIVVYGSNSNIDVAAMHFYEAAKEWNNPAFAPGTTRQNQIPTVIMNGQAVPVHFDLKVEKSTMGKVQSELQNPAPDRVYILAGTDSLTGYEDDATVLSNRQLNPTATDMAYALSLQGLPNANAAPTQQQVAGMTPASFIIGNLGFYDVARSQSRGNSSAAHELGHWMSHHIWTGPGTGWDPHVPMAMNNPFTSAWGRKRSIMSVGFEMQNRYPLMQDVSNLGYGQDFNTYLNAGGATSSFLGDRNPAGQLQLFNNQAFFSNVTQAMIFENMLGNIPSWNPNTGVAPQ